MVHIPAKFRENSYMHFLITVRQLNVTDGRGHLNISRPRPLAQREVKSYFSPTINSGGFGKNN